MAFQYVVKVVNDYLSSRISDIRFLTDVPETRPTTFVTTEAVPVGASHEGVKAEVLSRRRVIIYAWGADELTAATLAEDIRSQLLIASRTTGSGLRRVVIVGEPARRDDPKTGHSRSVLTVDVTLRSANS